MSQAAEDARILREAAELNRQDPLLRGSTLVFPDYGQVVFTGDLHGHRRNFERIATYCDLEHSPVRHVILHEIIHEEIGGLAAPDRSHEILLAAARWKCDYPDQVHFLQSNHELAQLTGQDISKGGRIVTYSFVAGIREAYASDGDEVYDAVLDMIASYPLAGRTANRILLTHSLPGPRQAPSFDPGVLDRIPTQRDMTDGGSAYELVWGRYQTPEEVDDLAQILDADLFVCGHQPQETGYAVVTPRMMIIASDHNHGVLLPIDLKKPYDMAGLERAIRPLASIA